MKLIAVISRDTAGFLASVLQGMQSERDKQRGFGVPKNADNSTFFAGFVVVEIKDHSTILKELLQQRTMGPLVKGQEATDRDT
ncbi:MAG: hypothetical protein ACPHYE_07230, partial [Henriciella sp.]